MGGSSSDTLQGPDLSQGVALDQLKEQEAFLGHYDGQQVILVKMGQHVMAVSATCKHYGGPLAEGLVADGVVRCPWHHARYDVRTGRNVGAPGLDVLSCFEVKIDASTARVVGERSPARPPTPVEAPEHVVIIGAGGAGVACAETLREQGYEGKITMFEAQEPFSVDRPNLSKDYLAGEAPEAWLPVRDESFFEAHQIDFVPQRVDDIDATAQTLRTEQGAYDYDALVFATGASPKTLPIEGHEQPHVKTLRTLDDARDIVASLEQGVTSAVVIGAGFIGLEAAASLTQRGVDVHVVAPEEIVLARIVGEEIGRMVQEVHTNNGVHFHLDQSIDRIDAERVYLKDGTALDASLVLIGVGVAPQTSLAEAAGVRVDDGILVDPYLRTNLPNVYAIGDVARYPYQGKSVRIEHWVVAQRHGQHAAHTIIGRAKPFEQVPFFWSRHWDVSLSYVGHATSTDNYSIDGDVEARDCAVIYRDEAGHIEAVLTIGRDVQALEAEHFMETGQTEALEALFGTG